MKVIESSATPSAIAKRLAAFAAEFDPQFEQLLQPAAPVSAKLLAAVHYSALGGGKRLRPFLVIRACELAGGQASQALPVAAAVECIHAFSLIHDDLPAMDDDDLRRGRPTCHKQFDEATAILAGDALVMLAFELLARQSAPVADVGLMVAELADGAGWLGMIGGQADDMSGQAESLSLALIESIHERKTARLFQAAGRLGVMAGGGSTEAFEALGSYGRHLGFAFQIVDDLLDLTASVEKLGKRVCKDADATKQTYPRGAGREQSRLAAQNAVRAANGYLEPFGAAADDLRALADFVLNRDY